MWTYYRDVTLYAAGICLVFGLVHVSASERISVGIITTIIIFGVFGTGLGVLAFAYFQKQQYYMYYNLGFTKRYLILRAWAVNFVLACILTVFVLPFL
ncbi:hypothetical protein [Dokdonia sp. PRO95]|uniref:hypothetical protein n=1 Tax=Dokdonia sp. PRO95 TaxID=1239415 RepID=UPI000554D77D|nr:hypothetical protein [Dokdonia sp. PRO95]